MSVRIPSLVIRVMAVLVVSLCGTIERTGGPIARANAEDGPASVGKMSRVSVAKEGRGFVLESSGDTFVPWGFNYDHDESGRLLEDYWDDEWPSVANDFAEMRDLGANVVRIHLQVARFLEAADKPDPKAISRLKMLLALAEKEGLYLDLTGLGCYHKADVPAWYDALSEAERWRAQGTFWQAVAEACAASPAVFCYDLMNEPVVPGGARQPGDWLGPPFGGKHFVQFVTLDQRDRPRPRIAREWVATLAKAIRAKDPKRLITVGLVDWSLDKPGLTSGFVPSEIAGELDFLCVHIYPKQGQVDDALAVLAEFARVGKPVVIEETFPLSCPLADFEKFLDGSRTHADGWIGFYWGKTRDEYAQGKTIVDALMRQWLDLFAARSKGAWKAR
jgi:Cellulase (glycosyl hydrolase family 5)